MFLVNFVLQSETWLLTFYKYIRNKKMTGSSQYGLRKGKSLPTNWIAFYDEMTGSVNKGRLVDVVYLDVWEAFYAVSHSILID